MSEPGYTPPGLVREVLIPIGFKSDKTDSTILEVNGAASRRQASVGVSQPLHVT